MSYKVFFYQDEDDEFPLVMQELSDIEMKRLFCIANDIFFERKIIMKIVPVFDEY